MTPLQRGSKGKEVELLQQFLGIKVDGDFGPITEAAVKAWQTANGLPASGIVDPATAQAMGFATTDMAERMELTGPLVIEKAYMQPQHYLPGTYRKEWVFLHHTAGGDNPYNTIHGWTTDQFSSVATEFLLGGQHVNGRSTKYDGLLVQALPTGCSGHHLGINSSALQRNSVAIELCNFGWVRNGRTYVGTEVDTSQTVTLAKPFRGHSTWHRYSDRQIAVLRNWLLFIADRDGIDIRQGLPALIRQRGADAFDVMDIGMCERTRGVWSHTNVRADKNDLFPQQEMMDMLVSL
jgi:hypothetical protein